MAGGAAPAEDTAATEETTEDGGRRLQDGADATTDADATTETTEEAAPAEPVQTEWKIELFVQPDPRAGTVNPQDMLDDLNDPAALAAVTAVSTAFGAPTAAAVELTEVAVAWATDGEPAGTGVADGIEITGTMTAAGWGYCVETGRRLQDGETKADDATAEGEAKTEDAAAEGEAKAEPTGESTAKPPSKEKVNWSRAMTAPNAAGDGHEFTIKLEGAPGATINFKCIGTSNNNNMM